MKVNDIIKETFKDTKMASGYYDEFIPVNVVWMDGILHFLRYEPPFAENSNANKYADRVENFFNEKFGKMVYHKTEDHLIGNIITDNWRALKQNSSSQQVKDQIKFTFNALKHLAKQGKIAPEGSHEFETDFWADQSEKNSYMRGL